MKTLLLSLLLIIGALLLIGSTCRAQSKESDRDWIDSLAVKYRIAFIESAMLRDQVVLDSISANVDVLILNSQLMRNFGMSSADDLLAAIHAYDHERQAQKLRASAYRKEIQSARTDFGAL